jgi:NADH dehydrogenase
MSSARNSDSFSGLHHIIVMGAALARWNWRRDWVTSWGKPGKAAINLIEKSRGHVWKLDLHENAPGSMVLGTYETNYLRSRTGVLSVTGSVR